MNRLLCGIVAVALSACAEKPIEELTYSEREELAKKFFQNCREQGLADGSPEMDACFDIEAEREITRRERSIERAQLMGAALMESSRTYGNSMSSYGASTYRQPMNCTSNAVGTYTYTNCY